MATINGTPASETINGTNDADTINGFGGDDIIYGLAGDDIINGGDGADLLYGGLGNDLYIMQGGNDPVNENAGEGIDEVRTDTAFYILAVNVEKLTGTGSTRQMLYGNEGANTIVGAGAGDDYLDGYWGDDWLIGGPGADTLFGHRGNDVFVVGADDIVYESHETNAPVPNGWDTVLATESYKLRDDAYIEVLQAIDPLATTPINLTGNNLHNLIYGNEGNNILIGGQLGVPGHGDHLNGLGGDDTYFIKASDLVFEHAGKGHDTVIVYPSNGFGAYALPAGAHVEVLGTSDASGTGLFQLAGNGFHQLIYGNEGDNILTSGGGGDHLNGLGGNDIYNVAAGDLVFEHQGKGHDTVNASSNYALNAGSHVETLGTVDASATTAINLTGNAFQNLIYGNEGNNVLTSGGGGDHLNGGGGNDIYFVTTGDQVFENSGKGHDTVNTDSSFALRAGSHVEVLGTVNASATDMINIAGNELHQVIYGNEGANVLTGGGGGDHLHGGGGGDILIAGAGADLMVGGAGVDMFQFQAVDPAIDVIQDFATGEKIDLSQIDANSFLSGEGSFTFIGTNAFSGKAGELRMLMDGTTAHLLGDVNGDGVADLHISVLNAPPLTGNDFIL